MENLGRDELIQIINYYKQRCSDLELQILQFQIKLNKLIPQKSEPVPAVKNTVNKASKTKE